MPNQRSPRGKWALVPALALVGATFCHAAVAQPAPSAPASAATLPGISVASPTSTPPARASPDNGPVAPAPPGTTTVTTPGPNGAIRRNATAEIHEDDLLLLSVDLDAITITDSLPAYGAPEDPLLPVGELARLLDLNLTVSPAEGQIVGRIGQAERPLTIDLANALFRVNGAGFALAPSDVAVTAVDIYMKASALSRFLPIEFKPDVEALGLKLHALEKLPIQARAERLQALRELHPETETGEDTLRLPSPYTAFSMPSFDVTAQLGGSFTAPHFPHGYDIRFAGDFLWTGLQGYIGSDQNGGVSSVRATFERHSPAGGLLGPLHATSVVVGDSFTPSLPVGPRSGSGRGFAFSTAPLEQTSVFNRIDLRGELPVGYDVELYINDILRSGQRTPVNGRYEFLNVPLVRGVNVIRIVTNGPRGERAEETRIINVGGGTVAKGKFTFEAGVVQQDSPLIDVGKPTTLDGLTSDLFSPGHGKIRASADMAYGLSSTMTLVAGAAMFPAFPPRTRDADGQLVSSNVTQQRALVSAGLRTSLLGAAIQVDAARDSANASALAIGVAAQPFGISTVARQVFYDGGFVDETVGVGGSDRPLVSHSELTMDLNVRPYKDALFPLTLRAARDYYLDRSTQLTGGFRTSATAKNVLLSGGVDVNANSLPGAAATYTATGNFSASTYYNFKWALRASLDYLIAPNPALSAVTITADRDINPHNAIRLGIGRNLTGTIQDTNFQLGDILRTRFGDLSISGNYATPSNQWQVGMTFSFGLLFDPLTKRYVVTRPGAASGGALVLDAFMDNNGDGVFDAGDKPVADVAIDGGAYKGNTDAKGHALVTGLGAAPTGRVQLNLDNIEDPYVSSPPHVLSFSPRPGKVLVARYPMTASSEIIVHVELRQETRKVGLSAVRVKLLRKTGAPVEGSTEFDGTVGFQALGVGTYDFTLDPEQATRLHMRLVKPVQIVVPPAGGPLPDLNVEVEFDRPPEN